jgi:hypothetical protein
VIPCTTILCTSGAIRLARGEPLETQYKTLVLPLLTRVHSLGLAHAVSLPVEPLSWRATLMEPVVHKMVVQEIVSLSRHKVAEPNKSVCLIADSLRLNGGVMATSVVSLLG